MKQDSSTNFWLLPKLSLFFRLLFHICLSIILIVLSAILSNAVEGRTSHQLFDSIKAILRNDQTVGNTALLARRLADLESLGIIECVTLTSPILGDIYNTTFKERCSDHPSVLNPFSVVNGEIRSISGDIFQVAFKSRPNYSYIVYLNLLRLCALLLLNAALLWYWAKMSAKELLEHRVREQLKTITKLQIESAVQESLAKIAEQVSHDVRSPLTALNMAVKSLENVPEDKRALISKAAARVNEIANDLLKSSKIAMKTHDSGLVKYGSEDILDIQTFLAYDLLVEIFDEKKAAFANRAKLNLSLDLKISEDIKMLVDRKEIARVLSNILNNAADAVGEQGMIKLSARSSRREVSIYVNDNGPGVPAAHIERLGRERFSTKSEGDDSGNGIGLTHAKRVVEAMNGKLIIQSAEGAGTMVSVSLPRPASDAPARHQF